jgi:hypothetical protein
MARTQNLALAQRPLDRNLSASSLLPCDGVQQLRGGHVFHGHSERLENHYIFRRCPPRNVAEDYLAQLAGDVRLRKPPLANSLHDVARLN